MRKQREQTMSMRSMLLMAAAFGVVSLVAPAAAGREALQQTVRTPTLASGTALREDELAGIPELRHTVSVNATGASLSNILDHLSGESPVAFVVSDRSIRFQRLLINAQAQPLFRVMDMLVAVLSHGQNDSEHPQYHWERTIGTGSRRVYELRVNAAARSAFDRELARPRREALRCMQDMRDLLGVPAADRPQRPHVISKAVLDNLDTDPSALALRGLTDQQMDLLLDGQHIYVPAAPINMAMENFHNAFVANSRDHGYTGEIPPFQPPADGFYTVAVDSTFYADDALENPTYMVGISPGRVTALISGGSHLGGDRVDVMQGIGLLPAAAENAPVYDLTAALDSPNVTDRQRDDESFNLNAIAVALHVNLYMEQFLRPPLHSGGLRVKKGTAAQIINGYCANWNLKVSKTEQGDYLLWDRDWARARQADVSDVELDRIRTIAAKHGGHLTPLDNLDLCAKHSWLQMAITIPFALGEPSYVNGYRDYLSKHVVGLMSDEDRAAASTSSGVPVSRLFAGAASEVTSELDYERYLARYDPAFTAAPSDAVVLRSHVSLSPAVTTRSGQPQGLSVNPSSLFVVSEDGRLLWQNRPVH